MRDRLPCIWTVSAGGQDWRRRVVLCAVLCLVFVLAACAGPGGTAAAPEGTTPSAQPARAGEDVGDIPATLQPVDLAQGELLQVVATTNLVGDAVAQVGGDAIDLTTLLPVGVDPHTYTLTPQDLRRLNDAHVVFINGLGLEEPLAPELDSLDRDVPIVSVNTNVEPIEFGQADEEEHPVDGNSDEGNHVHNGVDPHTWFRVENVMIWVDTIAETLSVLDPAQAERYTAAAAAYQEELAALEAELQAQIDTLPEANRRLVTDHDALGYLAHTYGFEVVGAVIPAYSTMASPSAQELAALQNTIRAAEVPAIFVSTTVNPDLANQIAQDLDIQVIPLYTGSLSDPDGPAPDYPSFMRYAVDAIVRGLQP